jgi:hypothetical protein
MRQPVFYNPNFKRKQPKQKDGTHLTPTFYGLPDRYHTLELQDFYHNLHYKTTAQIELLTGTKMIPLHYTNLKAHITKFVGHNKKYDGIVKLKLPQKPFTQSTTLDFITANKKGSSTVRKIISRRHPRPDAHNPQNQRKKLDCPGVTSNQVKESITRLHSKYLDSHDADHLSRLKLGKTHFNAQLNHSNLRDDPYCDTCKSQTNVDIQEDYKHALYACPNAQIIINHITKTLFPNPTNTTFNISDILITNKTLISKDYDCQGGRELINIVWDQYQILMTMNHTDGKTANKNQTLNSIIKTTKEIVKAFPESQVTSFIKSQPHLATRLQ